ncbi:N,N-dimethylaniline monooxygenase [Aureococcus anophagefferens]|nr:N,N-dimethylaniline monooxygenase [Aureococcus anophagefferens]
MPLHILTAIALLSAAHQVQGIQDLLAAKDPAQLDKVAHAQESPSRSPATRRLDAEAAASLKGRFLRSSASAQDLLAAKDPAQLDKVAHAQESLDLLAAKEPAQLDKVAHAQESLVALSGDSPSSDAEAAASLKGRFLRSSASAQDLLAAKEPAQLDDISHAQESLVALSGDSPSSDAEAAASLKGRFLRSSASAQDLLAAKEPAQLDKVAHAQESLVALSGDSPSSDAEAAASLKGRFLRSSASAQDLLAANEPAQLDKVAHAQESLDLLAAKEPAQLDDISHAQESLVALRRLAVLDAEAAASLKGRFLRSSASAQDLLAAKEPAQLDKAAASLAPEADVRRLSVSKEPAQFDDGLFGKTRLPLAARKYLRDDSNKQSSILFEGTIYSRGSNDRSSGVALDWATGAEVRTSCPNTSGSRKVSYADLRDAACFAYEDCGLEDFKKWKEFEHIEENYGDGSAVAKIFVKDGVVVLAFRGTDDYWGGETGTTITTMK